MWGKREKISLEPPTDQDHIHVVAVLPFPGLSVVSLSSQLVRSKQSNFTKDITFSRSKQAQLLCSPVFRNRQLEIWNQKEKVKGLRAAAVVNGL